MLNEDITTIFNCFEGTDGIIYKHLNLNKSFEGLCMTMIANLYHETV